VRDTLLFALLAASCAAQTLTFSNTVAYTPPSLPACGSSAFTVTQSAKYAWTTWCGSTSIAGGYVSGTGTGYCPGGSTGGYCSKAPTFSPQYSAANGEFAIWVNITSITGPGANNDPCGTPAITQGPEQTTQVPDQRTCNPPPPKNGPPNSPILIDTASEGFHLTSAQNGVLFRERANSPEMQMSWTDPAYHNGWLALPRDGNVEALSELFGNFTPQPPSDNPNGFRALAMYDLNHDGVIDFQDAIYPKLRVWIDANHDGIAQPEELHTLAELGVERISLDYHQSRRTDEYGNQFRYVSEIEDPAAKRENRCYDVFLVTR
jgi:hypothetical protein